MNDHAVHRWRSFDIDDNRFVFAAQDFRQAREYLRGDPPFTTSELVVVFKASRMLGRPVHLATALRVIGLGWAIGCLAVTFLLGRALGLGRLGGLAAAALTCVAPQSRPPASISRGTC